MEAEQSSVALATGTWHTDTKAGKGGCECCAVACEPTKACQPPVRMESTMALERELETYRRVLPDLLADEGRHVLIRDGEVIGVFPTRDEALAVGYERFDHQPFLVKQIQAHEEPVLVRRDIF